MEQSIFKGHCDRISELMIYHANAVKGIYIASKQGNTSAGNGWNKHVNLANAELNEILDLFEQDQKDIKQTSKNLMVEINLLCELLTLKNCEIADLQQTLNERD